MEGFYLVDSMYRRDSPQRVGRQKKWGSKRLLQFRQHTTYIILEYNIPLKQLSKSLEQNFSGISARPPADRSDRAEIS